MPVGHVRALRRVPIVLLALCAFLSAALTAAPAYAASSDVSFAIATTEAIVAPGVDVPITVEVRNVSQSATGAGRVTIAISPFPLAGVSGIESWMSGEGPVGPTVARTSTLAAAVSATTTTGVTVPSSSFAGEGAWGIDAVLTIGGTEVRTRSVVSVLAALQPAEVAVVVGIAVHAPAAGLFDAATLDTLTGPDGELTTQLDAVTGHTVTVGIDPRILASIRALGANAPTNATRWLERLQSGGFDSFVLQYADADPALQAQLGLSRLLDPGQFSDLPNDAAPAGMLTAWPTSRTLLWPAPNTVNSADLEVFRNSGYQQILLGSGNVSNPSQPATALGSGTALIAQDGPSAALARTFEAPTMVSWQGAQNVLQSEIALFGGQRLLVAPNRPTVSNAVRAGNTLTMLESSAMSRQLRLNDVSISGSTAVVDQKESDVRLSVAGTVLNSFTQIQSFSAVAVDPKALTEPALRRMLGLFATGWQNSPVAWDAAVSESAEQVGRTLHAVSVAPSSTINVLASEASLPFSVENTLSVAVRVRLIVAPSNGRIVVGEAVDAEIAANSRQTLQVPVNARIGNGAVALTASLQDQNGLPIGSPTVVQANVQADWEGVGAASLAVLTALLFTFGIARQVRKVRRARIEQVND